MIEGKRPSKTFKNRDEAEEWANEIELSIRNAGKIRINNDFNLTQLQLRRLYGRTKSNSKLNDIGHFISFDYFYNLWIRSEKRCAISGMMFSDYKPEGTRRRPFWPSVDRINCNQGYNEGNIRFVCVAANIARSDFPDEILYMLAKGICSNAPYQKMIGLWAD